MKAPFRIGLFVIGGVVLLLILCLGAYAGISSIAPVAAKENPTITPTPFLPATRTPTPFLPASGQGIPTQPVDPESLPPLPIVTATYENGGVPWAPYAGPIYPADTPIPTPMSKFKFGDDVMNVALLGMDLRPQGNSFRTDTIIILSLNRTKKTVTLVSFPRDLYVYIPAYGMQRINVAFPVGQTVAYPGGSFALFKDTMEYNFGLPIQHYALVNFWGFTAIINVLGGVDVYAASTYTDKRGHGNYTVYAGMNHMDGDTALWYARARYASNDFDRNRRQQEVIVAIMQRLINLNVLADLPTIYNTLAQDVESDISLDMLTPYLDMAAQLSSSGVRRYTIAAPDRATPWTNSQGSQVLIPNYDAIHAMLEEALNP